MAGSLVPAVIVARCQACNGSSPPLHVEQVNRWVMEAHEPCQRATTTFSIEVPRGFLGADAIEVGKPVGWGEHRAVEIGWREQAQRQGLRPLDDERPVIADLTDRGETVVITGLVVPATHPNHRHN